MHSFVLTQATIAGLKLRENQLLQTKQQGIEDEERLANWKLKDRLLILKGLGHATLGNFSTDQIVIELTKVST